MVTIVSYNRHTKVDESKRFMLNVLALATFCS